MGSTNTLNNQGFFSLPSFSVAFHLSSSTPKHIIYLDLPKGAKWFLNWHPLEGAGSFLLPFTFPGKKSHSIPQTRRPGHRGQIQQWPPWRGGVKNEVRPQNRHAVSGQRSSKKRFFVQCEFIETNMTWTKKPPSPSNSQIPPNHHPTFNTSTHHICFTLENHSTCTTVRTLWCASSPCGSREGMASSSPSHRLCRWSSAPPTWYSPDTIIVSGQWSTFTRFNKHFFCQVAGLGKFCCFQIERKKVPKN